MLGQVGQVYSSLEQVRPAYAMLGQAKLVYSCLCEVRPCSYNLGYFMAR